MEAYAVFSGGGARAVALVGCLVGCENEGVVFQGFAGTSAGSVIATLAAVGYTGVELQREFGKCTLPAEFLEDGGARLAPWRLAVQQLGQSLLRTKGRPFGSRFRAFWFFSTHIAELRKLFTTAGLYASASSKKPLQALLIAKLPTLDRLKDITFRDLHHAGARPLRIVAADLKTRKAVVYSAELTPDTSIFLAIEASMGMPVLFAPIADKEYLLSDGGLASNLPAVVFIPEHRMSNRPILAFDLAGAEPSPEETPTERNLMSVIASVVGTALSASDAMIAKEFSGIQIVPVHTPKDISVFAVTLSSDEIDALIKSGKAAVVDHLAGGELLRSRRLQPDEIAIRLRAPFGDGSVFSPPLAALVKWLETETEAKEVRACIMLPTGRNSVIVTFPYGFRDGKSGEGDPDLTLELRPEQGCGAASYFKGDVACQTDWSTLGNQGGRVARDRKVVVSVPIYAWEAEATEATPRVKVGALCVDTSTELMESGWGTTLYERETIKLDPHVERTIRGWAVVFAKLLMRG